MVRSIGADRVIDYTQKNFTQSGLNYDLILDCAGGHSLLEYKRVLNATDFCVMIGDMTGRGMLGIIGRLIGALL